jgi:hypothetical protein
VTIAAAGDIACDPAGSFYNGGNGEQHACAEKATAALLARIPHLAAVLPLGDTQYECGDTAAYARSYGPTWGRFKAISHPTIGNHEYGRSCSRDNPAPYFRYFGSTAGTPHKAWYSYDLGAWHLIALDSECTYGSGVSRVGGCGAGSREERWLRRDLASHRNRCTLAYWHEPRFSSGEHGDAQQMATIWNDLVAAHADIVLSGHNHDYERFQPIGATPQSNDLYQSPNLDPSGIREFVVGTGGKNHYAFRPPHVDANTQPLRGEVVRNYKTFGVLELKLEPTGYRWRFKPIQGYGFTDSGSGTCH